MSAERTEPGREAGEPSRPRQPPRDPGADAPWALTWLAARELCGAGQVSQLSNLSDSPPGGGAVMPPPKAEVLVHADEPLAFYRSLLSVEFADGRRVQPLPLAVDSVSQDLFHAGLCSEGFLFLFFNSHVDDNTEAWVPEACPGAHPESRVRNFLLGKAVTSTPGSGLFPCCICAMIWAKSPVSFCFLEHEVASPGVVVVGGVTPTWPFGLGPGFSC